MDQQNNTFTNQSLIDEQIFEKLVESKQFLNDQFLVQLLEKSINLGFSWEITKQTLRKYLLQLPLFEIKPKLDFKLLIDEEKFIEQLILLSIQMDAAASAATSNQSNKLSSNHNLLMDDENEDDNFDEFDNNHDDLDNNNEPQFTTHLQQQQYQPQSSLQHVQLQSQQIEAKKARAITNVSASLLNKLSNKPSMSKLEQEHQEFVKESMNRINDKSNLRPIIIDSEDVGCSGNKQIFSLSRVKQVADYFEKKNHKVYVIMSLKRKEQILMNNNSSNLLAQPSGSNTNLNQIGTDSSISSQQLSPAGLQQNTVNNQSTQATTQDQLILQELDKKNLVHYTPYKRIGCKSIMYNVESAMLQFAASKKAIIVSNNNFRRFLNQSDEYKQVIEERVLMYSFIDDTFMPAEDPLGKNGPSLNNFLRFEPFANQQYMKRCPYKKKCTYGSKCKFWHPERGDQSNQIFKTAHQSVVEEAQEQKSKFKIILNRQMNNRSPSPSNSLLKQLENATKDYNAEQLLLQNNKIKYLQSSTAPTATTFLQLTEQQNQRSQLLRSMGPNDPRSSSISASSTSAASLLSNFKAPKFDTDLIDTDLLIKSSQLKLDDLNTLEQFQSKNKSEDLLLNSNILMSKFQALSQHQDVSSSSLRVDDNDNDKNLSNHKLSNLVNVNNNSNSNSTSNINCNNSNNRADLRACLLARFNKEIADKVLNEYKEETDIEKLIFLAEGFDFDL